MFRNPPGKLLPDLCHKNALYTLKHAALAPDLYFGPIEVTPLGADTFRVSAVVENRGFLPTHLTQQAVKMKAISACRARLEADPPSAVEVLDGAERDLGHLAGWGERSAHYSRFKDWNPTARRVTWLVRLQHPGPISLRVVASAPKGGTIRGEVVLG
jgi:hypothetical protein